MILAHKPYRKQDYAVGDGVFLSQRQVNVLEQLNQGLSNKQIAHNLGVAEPTIKMHVSALLRAFGVQNRVQVLLRAKDMGFDTLDALKAKVKESLDEEAKQNARRDEISQIENHLVKMNNFDLPQSLVEEYTESSLNNFVRSMTQLKPEQLTADQKKAFEERIRPSVEKDLRIGYIVHAIAKKENLEATEADWKAELDKSLAANSKNKEDEKKIKAFFDERKAHILATLSERKVFDFLKEQAKYK